MSDLFQNVNGKLVPSDVCARKHGGNSESKAAFDSVSEHLSESQHLVYKHIRWAGGLTVDELSDAMGTTPNAVSGRVTELRIKGKIKKRGKRKTRSGCSAAVWVAV